MERHYLMLQGAIQRYGALQLSPEFADVRWSHPVIDHVDSSFDEV